MKTITEIHAYNLAFDRATVAARRASDDDLIAEWATLWNKDQDLIARGGRGLIDDPTFATVVAEMRRRELDATPDAITARGW